LAKAARLPLAFLIFILYLKIRIKTARLPLASSRLRAEGAEGAEEKGKGSKSE
jgi:hypothetical protein